MKLQRQGIDAVIATLVLLLCILFGIAAMLYAIADLIARVFGFWCV